MDSALRLQPGQQKLTGAQEVEAWHFGEAYLQTQLSTEPVDEQQAEAFLCQAYAVAELPPPARISWLDGPLQLVASLAPGSVGDRVRGGVGRFGIWDSVDERVLDSVWRREGDRVQASVGKSVYASVLGSVENRVEGIVWDRTGASISAAVDANVRASVRDMVRAAMGASVRAYFEAHWLALLHFFDVYLMPNDLHALAHFNQMVSGY